MNIVKHTIGRFNGEDVYLFQDNISNNHVIYCKGQKGFASTFNPIIKKQKKESMFNQETKIIDQGTYISIGCLQDTKTQFNELVKETNRIIKNK